MKTYLRELRALFLLAWPVVLAQLGTLGMGLVDTLMVGPLGETPLAALALANSLSVALFVFPLHIATGLDPLMSQAFGAGRAADAGRVAFRGLLLLTLLGIPVTAAHFWGGDLLVLLGQPEQVVSVGARYSRIVGLSMVPLFWFTMVRQHLQARGMMMPGTVAVIAANLMNVVANAALIYGLWGFPALGAEGSATATLLSRLAMLIAIHAVAWRQLLQVWPGFSGVFDLRELWRLLVAGVPVGFQIAVEVWAFVSAAFMMGWLGTTAVAAHSIAMNLGTVTFAVPMGIGAAASTRVGNLLGAGKPWDRAGWAAVGMGIGVMSFSALAFVAFPTELIRAFTGEPEVVRAGLLIMPLLAAFQMFDGAQVVLFGVLRGAGDTRFPMGINLLGWWGIGLPTAGIAAFAVGWGAPGIWLGLVAGLAAVALMLAFRLRHTVARGGYRVG